MTVKVVAIGDCHFPFVNKKSLRTIYTAIEELQPTYVVQLGDLYDQFCSSRFPRSISYITPEAEYLNGHKLAMEFWRKIREVAPKAKCHQIIGNHDERAKKKILQVAPDLEPFLDVERLYQFEGVKTQPSEREGLILDGVLYMHGYLSRLGDHARHAGMPVVCGHTHRGGTSYFRQGPKTLWELNCGFVGDTSSRPLSYGRQRYIATTTQGFGIIERIGKSITPIFVPLPN
jgi:UDP-2,3-diacylglucosamine pyrophosphatase LpxH